MLRARLFGGLWVEVDGTPLPPVPGLKPRSLLAYLLLHPGPHPRVQLAARFWPDVLDTSARASLRVALWTLRGALEPIGAAAYIGGDRESAGLAAGLPRQVDAEEFGMLVARGDRQSLERAVGLASGPLLADITDDWALAAQDEHRERLAAALERLAEECERAGDLDAAVGWTRRALEQDRLREGAYRALMRRLALSGERGLALAAFRRCRATLAAELGVAPSAETRALADSLRAGAAEALAPAAAPREAGPSARPAGEPALVGRERELGMLLAAWFAARDGRGGVALVTGEAGIGKSRLAAELAARAEASGGVAVVGAALELDGGPPFAPWSEALAQLVTRVAPPPPAATWPGDLARLSAAVETRWGRAPGPAALVPELERARLFEAMVELVAWSAAAAPLLLVLEDLHRADPSSLALLAYLGRRLPRLPALVLATRREAAESAELDVALDALSRRSAVVASLSLRSLADADVTRIVAAAAPQLAPAGAARAVAAADGNPLLAREAARALAAGEDPAQGLRASVRGPLGRLEPQARLLVDLAAAAGRPLEGGEAADLVGAEALPAALAGAVAADLLDAAADRRVRFVHALVREACYGELAPARRAWAHARLAEALAQRPRRSAAEVGRHLRLAGQEAPARRYLAAAAADARALGALDDAAAFLAEAAGLADDDPAAAAELWLRLADVEAWRGQRAAMDEAFARARALLEAGGDLQALAGAHAARGGWLHTVLCYPREALEACRQALALLDAGRLDAPEVRALALVGRAWAEAIAGDAAAVEGLIAQAEAIPESGGDAALAARCELARSAALVRAGRFAEAEAPAERSAGLAEGAGRPDIAHLARDVAASAAACRGDFARALEIADGGRRGAWAGLLLEASGHATRAHALSRLGRHAEAIAEAERETLLAERHGHAQGEAAAAFDIGCVLLAAGEVPRAVARLQAALAVETRLFSRPLARLRLAEALLASGALEEAAAELGQVPFEPIGPADLPQTLVPRLARLQGLIAAARGERELALRRLEEAEAGWRRLLAQAPSGDAFAATVTDLGRPPVAGLVEPGLELGWVLADRAGLLIAAGRLGDARTAVEEAAGLADALAYDGYRDRLAASRRALDEEIQHAGL
ncbi:MAG: hypothetical protein QOK40_2421 [Miltoncostaeaceae bacterium]|nr:hypothetical protein [Miltoncostaeaceae bacterium]